MSDVEIVKCPVCGQKLALQSYIAVNTHVVCANARCETSLRITGRNPAKIEQVATEDTFSQDYRPESYG